jgi:hypothetical protein
MVKKEYTLIAIEYDNMFGYTDKFTFSNVTCVVKRNIQFVDILKYGMTGEYREDYDNILKSKNKSSCQLTFVKDACKYYLKRIIEKKNNKIIKKTNQWSDDDTEKLYIPQMIITDMEDEFINGFEEDRAQYIHNNMHVENMYHLMVDLNNTIDDMLDKSCLFDEKKNIEINFEYSGNGEGDLGEIDYDIETSLKKHEHYNGIINLFVNIGLKRLFRLKSSSTSMLVIDGLTNNIPNKYVKNIINAVKKSYKNVIIVTNRGSLGELIDDTYYL